MAEKQRGKRGKRQSQPGLEPFVLLMAAAFLELTGLQPTVSTESDCGRKPIGRAERFGKFTDFMKAVARHVAAKLDDGDMWPTEFAVINLTPQVEKALVQLVKKAAG